MSNKKVGEERKLWEGIVFVLNYVVRRYIYKVLDRGFVVIRVLVLVFFINEF